MLPLQHVSVLIKKLEHSDSANGPLSLFRVDPDLEDYVNFQHKVANKAIDKPLIQPNMYRRYDWLSLVLINNLVPISILNDYSYHIRYDVYKSLLFALGESGESLVGCGQILGESQIFVYLFV